MDCVVAMETMRFVTWEGSAVRLGHSHMAFSDVKSQVLEGFPFKTHPPTHFTTRNNHQQTANDCNYLN